MFFIDISRSSVTALVSSAIFMATLDARDSRFSGKISLSHNHILKEDGKDLILEDLNGNPWREIDARHPPL